ncbi:hypothetical protein ACFMJX_18500, partial [Acinetobacter baumannii]
PPNWNKPPINAARSIEAPVSRISVGAVFGAWIGAVLLGNDWSFTAILSLLLIPATAAAVAVFIKSIVAHTDAT